LVIDGSAGVTAMDWSVAAITVSTVLPVTPFNVAEIEEVPTAAVVARPAAVIVAVDGVAEAHVTLLVTFCVLLSLNVPVAVNCWVAPLVMLGLAGVTAMDCSVAAVTVATVEPEMAPDVALTVEVPTAMEVANPAALMVSTDGVAEVQVTLPVRFCVLLSLNVPIAVNCCVAPLVIDGLAGVTVIDCNVAAVTVRIVLPVTPFNVAEIDEVPTAAPVANPALVIIAVDGVAEAHVTLPVRFCVLLSLKVPVAVNCCVAPLVMLGLAGVTAMDCNVAAVTVRTVLPVTPFNVPEIDEVPTPTPVAKPATVIVAVDEVAEAQVTLPVRFCVLLSLNVPVAVNCRVAPLVIDGLAGVTAMDCRVAAVTVRTVLPVTPFNVAEMEEVPTPAPVARPAAVIVATDGVAEVQVTLPVRFCVVLSVNVPVAVNC
jgi:hypothetical protein